MRVGYFLGLLIGKIDIEPVPIVVKHFPRRVKLILLPRSVISLASTCISLTARPIFTCQTSLIGGLIAVDLKWHRSERNEVHWRRTSMFCFINAQICSNLVVRNLSIMEKYDHKDAKSVTSRTSLRMNQHLLSFEMCRTYLREASQASLHVRINTIREKATTFPSYRYPSFLWPPASRLTSACQNLFACHCDD